VPAAAPAQPDEIRAHDPVTADGTYRPSAVAHQPDAVLGDEDANRRARRCAQPESATVLAPRRVGPIHAERSSVTE
jgi:hypothetical protein